LCGKIHLLLAIQERFTSLYKRPLLSLRELTSHPLLNKIFYVMTGDNENREEKDIKSVGKIFFLRFKNIPNYITVL
jgi:hypothetical protein